MNTNGSLTYRTWLSEPPKRKKSFFLTIQDFVDNIYSFYPENCVFFVTESPSDARLYFALISEYRKGGTINFQYEVLDAAGFGEEQGKDLQKEGYLSMFFNSGFLQIDPKYEKLSGKAAVVNFVHCVKEHFPNCYAILDRDLIDLGVSYSKPSYYFGYFEANLPKIQSDIENLPNTYFLTEACDLESSILGSYPHIIKRLIKKLKISTIPHSDSAPSVESTYFCALCDDCLLGEFRFLQTSILSEQNGFLDKHKAWDFFAVCKENDVHFLSGSSLANGKSLAFSSLFSEICTMSGVDEKDFEEPFLYAFRERFNVTPVRVTLTDFDGWDPERIAWAHDVAFDWKVNWKVPIFWRFCNGHSLLSLFFKRFNPDFQVKDREITDTLIDAFLGNDNALSLASSGTTFTWLFKAVTSIKVA